MSRRSSRVRLRRGSAGLNAASSFVVVVVVSSLLVIIPPASRLRSTVLDLQFHCNRNYSSMLVGTRAGVTFKPNSITLASSELAPNMFEASCESASVMEFGREPASSC